jgi:glucose/arabinose dehydrogenase
LGVFVALLTSACAASSTPQPPADVPGTIAPIDITGTEKIAWDQPADDANQLARYQYIGYVDGVPQLLTDAMCDGSATTGLFPCIAGIPPMSAGLHQLQLAAQETDGLQRLGGPSAPLSVNLIAIKLSSASQRTSRAGTTSDGIPLVVETLAIGLTAPSALGTAPDGRVFIAERNGRILVWENGQLLPGPAFELADIVQTSETGLVGLALHRAFQTNGRVFIAYTARDSEDGFVNRVVRVRDVRSSFGQAAVILEDRVRAAPLRPPRIGFGPDGTVYVTFPANDRPTAESFASYSGKILRINEDGTTPRDNPGATPIIATADGMPGGFDWQPSAGHLWLAARDWQGRDFVTMLLLKSATSSTFDSVVDPSGVAFYGSSRIRGFADNMFIGALAGMHIRRVRFNRADPGHIEDTERLLDGQYGRISSVIAGPDGALYICTSNAGTALATADGDRLLRLSSGS